MLNDNESDKVASARGIRNGVVLGVSLWILIISVYLLM